MTAPIPSFAPFMPAFTQVMPEANFDSLVNNFGMRLLYLKSHACPCSQSTGTAGAANPTCLQCDGRGIYYDQPGLITSGIISFQHGPGTSDEPGMQMNATLGGVNFAEPTLTLARNGPNNEAYVYQQSTLYDAYVEIDAASRLNTTLIAGVREILPYGQGVQVQDVTVWDSYTKTVKILDKTAYQVRNNHVWLNEPYTKGTSYVVSFTAMPVYVAFRKSGSLSHSRPFGLGTSGLPKRFHLQTLDLWLRSTNPDDGSPNSPYYTSSKTSIGTTDTPSTPALQIQGWS